MSEGPEKRSGRLWSRVVNTVIGVFTLGLGVLIALVLFVRGSAQAVPPDPLSVSISVTDQSQGQELSAQMPVELRRRHPAKGIPVIDVDTARLLQKIGGFGAAMSQKSADLLENVLSPDGRSELLTELFGSTGLDLNVLQVPMGSAGGRRPYTYDDGTVDPDLARFSIGQDEGRLLPALRQAYSHNYNLRFVASLASAPAWMKANNALDNVGNSGRLDPSAAQAYADYFVKYIEGYLKQRIPISAITPADSPGQPTRNPGMNISARSEIKLLTQDLVPALRQAGLQTRVYAGDLNWSSTAYATKVATSIATTEIIGLAWHCYAGDPTAMNTLHSLASSLTSIVSECAPVASRTPIPETIISSLRNWATQVSLGDLVSGSADQTDAADDPAEGTSADAGLVTISQASGEVLENESFYELGQASEFFQPGAYRAPSNTFVRYSRTATGHRYGASGIDDVAAVNPNGSIALMVYNNSASARTFAVRWHGYSFTYRLAGHATASFRWRQGGLHNITGNLADHVTTTGTTTTPTSTAAQGG